MNKVKQESVLVLFKSRKFQPAGVPKSENQSIGKIETVRIVYKLVF